MATLTENPPRPATPDPALLDQRIELHGVSWETYEGLLLSNESQRGSVRMSYDRGRLVLARSTSFAHQIHVERLGLIVRLTAAGLGLSCTGVGRTTLIDKEAGVGVDPDQSFYLANEPRIRGKTSGYIDPNVDPPPDLALEVEPASRDPGMLGIYGTLGVPEIWHFDGRDLRALVRQRDGGYAEVAASLSLPSLPLGEIPRWLERANIDGETAMLSAYLDWVRSISAPASGP